MLDFLQHIPADPIAIWSFLGGTLLSFFKGQIISALRYILFCQFVDGLKQLGVRVWKLLPGALKWTWDKFVQVESWTVDSISKMSQSEHWSFFWIVYAIAWAGFREFHRPAWYTDEIDFVIVTLSFSVVPFLIENSLKHATALQQEKLEDQQELLLGLAELNIELGEKILGVLAQQEESDAKE